MPAVLNTNMASLYAQKNLSTAQADLATSVQRLSSGKRINSARDDAAGFAVAEAVAATKNITDQSIRNTQDAISLVQTAEGALDVVGKILQRVLTLTTQKENGSLTSDQVTSVNDEITMLLAEVTKIRDRTVFQGGQGSIFGTSKTFTTGAGSSSNTTVDISDLSLNVLGSVTGTATDSRTVQSTTYGTTVGVTSAFSTAITKGARVLVNGLDTGVTVAADVSSGTSVTLSSAISVKQGDSISFYNGFLNTTSERGLTAASSDNFIKVSSGTTVNNGFDVAAGSKVYVNGVDTGRTVVSLTTVAGYASGSAVNTNIQISGNLTLAATDKVTFYAANTAISANSSSTQITNAVQINLNNRSELGAQQTKLNFIVDNMQTLSNNLADSKSRIVDTDYAAETAALTRGQILQQAATSMLAQANQMPNVILTLLK